MFRKECGFKSLLAHHCIIMEKPHKQLLVVLGILEHEGKILVLRRVSNVAIWHHKWQFPGGKAECGESTEQAVIREIHEETGLTVANPELLGIHTHHWDHPDFTQQTFLVTYRVQAPSKDVVLLPHESDDYQWVTPEEYVNLPDHLDGNVELFQKLYVR